MVDKQEVGNQPLTIEETKEHAKAELENADALFVYFIKDKHTVTRYAHLRSSVDLVNIYFGLIEAAKMFREANPDVPWEELEVMAKETKAVEADIGG